MKNARYPMTNYENYELKCKIITENNNHYIQQFKEYLTLQGLSKKTICRHCNNVEFYLNTFSLREDANDYNFGCTSYALNDFFGYFFIRKCMWSTPNTIKSTAASFKKFYAFMLSKKYITKEQYEELTSTIKDNMFFWQEECEDFNNPVY